MQNRLKPAPESGSRPKETGAVIKKGKGLIKAALVYPNTYRAGMSSLGFQTVYKTANRIDYISCERVFWNHTPDQCPKSVETGLRLDQFDIILFSISFENDFINLVQLLARAGIPLRSRDRNPIHPIVTAGGIACFLNPEPLSAFIDVFLLGEAEILLDPFFELFAGKKDKISFLKGLENGLPGSYVPLFTQKAFQKIKVQYLDNLDDQTTCSAVLSNGAAFRDTFLIETLKGCPHGCRFCSAGFIYRPPRTYPLENICRAIDQAVDKTDRIGIVSSAVADHPEIISICDYASELGLTLSFSSLRADRLEDNLVQALARSRLKTATIAPEAGSQRMRSIINKHISEKEILNAVKKLVRAGIINLRLYFMIGLPFENTEDVHAIVTLVRKIKSVFLSESRKNKKIGTITLSINPFIPKPWTPFQRAGMDDEKSLKTKTGIIREGLKKTANVKINFESIKTAKIHALLSRGNEKISGVIEQALAEGWPSAMKQNREFCDSVIYDDIPPGAPLPWDFLDNHVSREFLNKEYRKAGQEKQSAPCPMAACRECRICI